MTDEVFLKDIRPEEKRQQIKLGRKTKISIKKN